MNFSELIGKQIVVYIPHLGDKLLHHVKLVGVESSGSGIWIEHIDFTGAVYLAVTGQKRIPSGPMASASIFVPFHEIVVVMAAPSAPVSEAG